MQVFGHGCFLVYSILSSVTSNTYNTSMRFVSGLWTWHPRAQPDGGVFTNQTQIQWMCYNCFVLWCMSRWKLPLACIWHKEQFFTAGRMLQNSAGGLALDFHAVKSERIYHAEWHNLPCIRHLYKHMYLGATNQMVTHIICMNCALLYG